MALIHLTMNRHGVSEQRWAPHLHQREHKHPPFFFLSWLFPPSPEMFGMLGIYQPGLCVPDEMI